MLSSLLRAAAQLVLPAHCAACGSPAPADGRFPLCQGCGRALAALMARPYCPLCGRNAGPYTSGPDGCLFCRNYPVQFNAAVRVGPYEEPLRGLILRLKRQGRVDFVPFLGRLLAERVAVAPWADRIQAVVPVPLHWTRRLWRGFNQAALVAREVRRAAARRAAAGRLCRTRPTPSQMLLPAKQRRRNVRRAFRPARLAPSLKGKAVLLVDDVMTSGTTIGECQRVLRQAGAAEVYVAVLATADYDDPGPW
jgi:ComF family protein